MYPPTPLPVPTRLLDLIGGSLVLGVTVDRDANGAEYTVLTTMLILMKSVCLTESQHGSSV
jgi:hypothetical protein